MYTYKPTQLTFNDGTIFTPRKITVIVGPNNTGKSRALKDIATLVTTPHLPVVVVKDVQWAMPQSLQELYDSYKVEPYQHEQGDWSFQDISYYLSEASSIGHGRDWRSAHETRVGRGDKEFFANIYGAHLFAFLTTEHRLSLVKESESPTSDKERARLLHIVYAGGQPLVNKIRELVKEAFGQDISLDYAALRRLLFRVGDDFSSVPVDPREAMPILARYDKLDNQGDGIRSFVGIGIALLSVNRSLFLIDEPELFLHPPQAFRIGEFLADQSSDYRQIVLRMYFAESSPKHRMYRFCVLIESVT